MNNREIYALFRAQDRWLKFGDFLENNIEWIYEEDEDEANMGILHNIRSKGICINGAGGGEHEDSE